MPIKEQYHPDWLDALAMLRGALDGHDIQPVWKAVAPQFRTYCAVQLVTRNEATEDHQPDILLISTLQDFDSYPRIERIEILTYAAAVAHFERVFGLGDFKTFSSTPRESFINLCIRSGCWWTNTPNIRERWRLIDYYQQRRPNEIFEDRPSCVVCSQPVATKSGAWVKSGQAIMTGEDLPLIYQPKLHDECSRFVHRVLAPLKKKES